MCEAMHFSCYQVFANLSTGPCWPHGWVLASGCWISLGTSKIHSCLWLIAAPGREWAILPFFWSNKHVFLWQHPLFRYRPTDASRMSNRIDKNRLQSCGLEADTPEEGQVLSGKENAGGVSDHYIHEDSHREDSQPVLLDRKQNRLSVVGSRPYCVSCTEPCLDHKYFSILSLSMRLFTIH